MSRGKDAATRLESELLSDGRMDGRDLKTRLLVRKLDLASMRSVREFVAVVEAERLIKRLDLLILNAGIFFSKGALFTNRHSFTVNS